MNSEHMQKVVAELMEMSADIRELINQTHEEEMEKYKAVSTSETVEETMQFLADVHSC